MAWEITASAPSAAPLFFAALQAGPLPGYLMESARRQTLVRLTLRAWQNHLPVSAAGFALLEPWPSWNREFLKNRHAFYQATGFGDAAQARADLATFLAAEAAPFGRDLAPLKPVTAAR